MRLKAWTEAIQDQMANVGVGRVVKKIYERKIKSWGQQIYHESIRIQLD